MLWNNLLFVLLRTVAWLLPWVPLDLLYRLAEVAGTCAYYLVPNARRAIHENIAQVIGASPTSPRVRCLAREAFRTDARNWVDTLRIRDVTSGELLERVQVEGWEYLDAALAEGKGAILLGMHLGNFDLVGQILLARGYQLTVPAEHMKPEALFQFLMEGRRSKGAQLVAVDQAPRELLRALRAGTIVGVTGDRYVAGKGIAVPFFGKQAVLPRGPVSLARLSGAPLLLGYGVRLASNTFRGYVSPPIHLARHIDDAEAMQSIVGLMEGAIREHVGQWLVFSPVWAPDSSENRADIIGRYKEPAV